MLSDISGSSTAEKLRLRDTCGNWKKWGPYLSERQWATVREDYSDSGNAWDYFPHDHARSRAYRWGEDGLAGLSDDHQLLCFALALWNGQDPILKERLFGLSNTEGNHGEDVKEYYFYLDNTPTHSYMKWLYKYCQSAYPYNQLVAINRQRGRNDPEYELIDTGVFDENRYFDIFVEYAKASPEDILIRVTVANRGPGLATLHLLPTLWFRNTWSSQPGSQRPILENREMPDGSSAIMASHPDLGVRYLYCDRNVPLLFTGNETNQQRIFGTPNQTPYVKDGINDCVVLGRHEKVNPDCRGTKACSHYVLEVPPAENRIVRLRLTPEMLGAGSRLDRPFDELIETRKREADEFYETITPASLNKDQALIMRQALAGMLWSKQYYSYDVDRWTTEHGQSYSGRNHDWTHMVNGEVISMPDKWEYPWYAAWDLAFHAVALSLVDLSFAKKQLDLLVRDDYLHPSGQLPAYEWNFGDVNPPVHAWATRLVYELEKSSLNRGDKSFLDEAFQKLVLNFTWWVNRKDPRGNNIFGGGFLGLDNIGVFDRSSPLPTGGYLEQADGTAWMAFYCQSMLQIAVELALQDPWYERMVIKFAKHFLWIASAMDNLGSSHERMWDEEDGFFYDVLRYPDGRAQRLRVRSIVGLLPLCAATVFRGQIRKHMPEVVRELQRFLADHPKLSTSVALESMMNDGVAGTRLLDLMDERKYRRVLSKMLDESEFLSPYGIRSLSRYHLAHPYVFKASGQEFCVRYVPAESDSPMFGGNSNWRGPVWMPINILIIRSLLNLYQYYGNDFQIECPTGSGHLMNLFEVSREIVNRLTRIFLRDDSGCRPVHAKREKFQTDPYWRDCILFYEYFHGENGAGLGASHQTGWTGVIAALIQLFAHLDAPDVLAGAAPLSYANDPASVCR